MLSMVSVGYNSAREYHAYHGKKSITVYGGFGVAHPDYSYRQHFRQHIRITLSES